MNCIKSTNGGVKFKFDQSIGLSKLRLCRPKSPFETRPLAKPLIAYRLDATKRIDRFANRRVGSSCELGLQAIQLAISVQRFVMFCTASGGHTTTLCLFVNHQPAKVSATWQIADLQHQRRGAASKVTEHGENTQAWLAAENAISQMEFVRVRHALVRRDDNNQKSYMSQMSCCRVLEFQKIS